MEETKQKVLIRTCTDCTFCCQTFEGSRCALNNEIIESLIDNAICSNFTMTEHSKHILKKYNAKSVTIEEYIKEKGELKWMKE